VLQSIELNTAYELFVRVETRRRTSSTCFDDITPIIDVAETTAPTCRRTRTNPAQLDDQEGNDWPRARSEAWESSNPTYKCAVFGRVKWNVLKPRLHDTTCCETGCQTSCQNGLTTGCIVYTNMQPVVKPVWQPVWQPAVSCIQPVVKPVVQPGLTTVLNEQSLFVQHGCQTDNRLDVCLHDTAGCQTGCTTGFTTGCIV